jgi:thymidine kinase
MIEVTCGPMFSGKTEKLLRKLKRAKIAEVSYIVVKPNIASRYADEEVGIVTHDQESKAPAVVVSSLEQLYEIAHNYQIIAIDEAQFFDKDLYKVVLKLADEGKRILASGLDMDFQREPFETMSNLLSVADKIDKINSVCMGCKGNASYSYRTVNNTDQKFIGSTESYLPLCRTCYNEKYNS